MCRKCESLLMANLIKERDNLRSELQRIVQLDPSKNSQEGFNEWGEADCFRLAQEIAKKALTPTE